VSNPLAICHDGQMVGFSVYCFEPEAGTGYIDRLMVAEDFQGQGYSRAARAEVIAQLRNTPGCQRIRTFYKPINKVEAALSKSLGFLRTGEIDKGEEVVVLNCAE